MIDREKMKTMTDAEIRAGGGSVHYCKGKLGVTRVTSNYATREPINIPHPVHGRILRLTEAEAKLDPVIP